MSEKSRSEKSDKPFVPLNIALLSVSDRRTLATDDGGIWLEQNVRKAGHHCIERQLLRPELHKVRALVAGWIADERTQVVLVCGGSGLGPTDISHPALGVLFDVPVDGFGELFRRLSLDDIGTSALQSRAFAGLANGTLIACLPSSQGAIALGWEKILAPQLDARTRPCNFVGSLKPVAG